MGRYQSEIGFTRVTVSTEPRHLIVSAWWPEQRLLHAILNQAAAVDVRLPPFPILDEEIAALRANVPAVPSNVDFLCCGIGPVQGAMMTAEALAKKHYVKVFFCATAGCYVKSKPLLRVERCARVVASDVGVFENQSYLPPDNGKTTAVVEFPGANDTVCLSSFSVTKSDAVAQKMSAVADVENLEFYGVASAAKKSLCGM